jgi:hypothetical protein
VLIRGSNNICNTQNGTFTINELIDIVFEARHIYQVQFANRRIPNIRAIVSSVEDQPAWRFTIYRQEFCEWFLGQDKLESNFFK